MANRRLLPGSTTQSLTAPSAEVAAFEHALGSERLEACDAEFECIEGELVEPAPRVLHLVEQSGRTRRHTDVTVVVSVGAAEVPAEVAEEPAKASEAAWLLDLNRGRASGRHAVPHHRAVASYAAHSVGE